MKENDIYKNYIDNQHVEIRKRINSIYPNLEPFKVVENSSIVQYKDGTFDYLYGPLSHFEIYLSDHKEPHWLYVTYGYSTLFANEPNNENYQTELVFRLKKNEDTPPSWPLMFMANFGFFMINNNYLLCPGVNFPYNKPINPDSDSELCNVYCELDPELGTIDDKEDNCHIMMVNLVALTNDEIKAIQQWNGQLFLEAMLNYVPLFITDLNRESLMKNEEFVKIWKKGVEELGSTTEQIYADEEDFRYGEINTGPFFEINKKIFETIKNLMKSRLLKNKPLTIYIGDNDYLILNTGNFKFEKKNKMSNLTMPIECVEEIISYSGDEKGFIRIKSCPLTLVFKN